MSLAFCIAPSTNTFARFGVILSTAQVGMSKTVLDMGGVRESFFGEAAMIGISCPLPAHRFCWTVNRHFETNFRNVPESTICVAEDKGGKEVVNFLGGAQTDMFGGAPAAAAPAGRWYFPTYTYTVPHSSATHIIYQLKCGTRVLLPEVKHLDYLWLVQTAEPEHDAHTILLELRTAAFVQLAQDLTREQLKKSISNLLL